MSHSTHLTICVRSTSEGMMHVEVDSLSGVVTVMIQLQVYTGFVVRSQCR